MEAPLRQPRTFWQWLTNQEGSLFAPPPPPIQVVQPGRSALDAIESAIDKLHEEMENIRNDEYAAENQAYHMLVQTLSKLHDELIRRSQGETSETIPAR